MAKSVYANGIFTVVFEDGTNASSAMDSLTFLESIAPILNDPSLTVQEKDDKLKEILFPELKTVEEKTEKFKGIKNGKYSHLFEDYGNYVTIPSISDLSIPEDLVFKIMQAIDSEDSNRLQAYLNFWKLASCNPDSRVRENLFWFLQKYHMHISKTGMFMAFRNVIDLRDNLSENFHTAMVDLVQKEYFKMLNEPNGEEIVQTALVYKKYNSGLPEFQVVRTNEFSLLAGEAEGTVAGLFERISQTGQQFTDGHTKTMDIRLGLPVTMPRKNCDSDQSHTCSSGLHAASIDFIRGGSFGNTTLAVLINPADVVAVPKLDEYKKIRTCAYWPVAVLSKDENGEVIVPDVADGFEDNMSYDVVDQVIASLGINNEETTLYRLSIPEAYGVRPQTLESSILGIVDRTEEALSVDAVLQGLRASRFFDSLDADDSFDEDEDEDEDEILDYDEDEDQDWI